MGKKSNKKKPRVYKSPKKAETRREFDPEHFDQMTPSWKLRWLVKTGDSGWKCVSYDEWWNDISQKIRQFEEMTWAEIKRYKKKHHSISVHLLNPEARQYLIKQHLDDYDKVFSFSIGGKKKIIGIRIDGIFNVLWYDPKHAICPSYLKHT